MFWENQDGFQEGKIKCHKNKGINSVKRNQLFVQNIMLAKWWEGINRQWKHMMEMGGFKPSEKQCVGAVSQ